MVGLACLTVFYCVSLPTTCQCRKFYTNTPTLQRERERERLPHKHVDVQVRGERWENKDGHQLDRECCSLFCWEGLVRDYRTLHLSNCSDSITSPLPSSTSLYSGKIWEILRRNKKNQGYCWDDRRDCVKCGGTRMEITLWIVTNEVLTILEWQMDSLKETENH